MVEIPKLSEVGDKEHQHDHPSLPVTKLVLSANGRENEELDASFSKKQSEAGQSTATTSIGQTGNQQAMALSVMVAGGGGSLGSQKWLAFIQVHVLLLIRCLSIQSFKSCISMRLVTFPTVLLSSGMSAVMHAPFQYMS